MAKGVRISKVFYVKMDGTLVLLYWLNLVVNYHLMVFLHSTVPYWN